MHVFVAATEQTDTHAAVAELAARVRTGLAEQPGFVLLAYSEHHDPAILHGACRGALPDAALLGSSTCRGLMTGEGLFGFGKPALGLVAMADPDGTFGTASIDLGEDLSAAIPAALLRAQTMAGRPGEVPDLVWLHGSPGREETVIAGIRAVLGADVLLSGGSSADETIGGAWSQFDTGGVSSEAALVLVYSDAPITHHFRNGYLPTEHGGKMTRASGRILHEIDGQPAAEVYNRWTGGLIDGALADPSVNILGASAWHPLGKSIGRIGPSPDFMVDCYCLVHPDSVTPDGGLRLFADVAQGDKIVLMKSGQDALVQRAMQVVQASIDLAPEDQPITGGVMVFCAGCMLALGDGIRDAADQIRDAYGPIPFMGVFTFGEQGSFANGDRVHGNLMISSTLFSAQDGSMG